MAKGKRQAAASGCQRLVVAHRKWRKRRRASCLGGPPSNFKPTRVRVRVCGCKWSAQTKPVVATNEQRAAVRVCDTVRDAESSCIIGQIGYCKARGKQAGVQPEVSGECNSITELDNHQEPAPSWKQCGNSVGIGNVQAAYSGLRSPCLWLLILPLLLSLPLHGEIVKKFASNWVKNGQANQIDLSWRQLAERRRLGSSLKRAKLAHAVMELVDLAEKKLSSDSVIELKGCDMEAEGMVLNTVYDVKRRRRSLGGLLGMIIEKTSGFHELMEVVLALAKSYKDDLVSDLSFAHLPSALDPPPGPCHLSHHCRVSMHCSIVAVTNVPHATRRSRRINSVPQEVALSPRLRIFSRSASTVAWGLEQARIQMEKLIEGFGGSIIRVKRLFCCSQKRQARRSLIEGGKIVSPSTLEANDCELLVACTNHFHKDKKQQQQATKLPSPRLWRPTGTASGAGGSLGPLELKLITPVVCGGVSQVPSFPFGAFVLAREFGSDSGSLSKIVENDTVQLDSSNVIVVAGFSSCLALAGHHQLQATSSEVWRKLDDNDGDHHLGSARPKVAKLLYVLALLLLGCFYQATYKSSLIIHSIRLPRRGNCVGLRSHQGGQLIRMGHLDVAFVVVVAVIKGSCMSQLMVMVAGPINQLEVRHYRDHLTKWLLALRREICHPPLELKAKCPPQYLRRRRKFVGASGGPIALPVEPICLPKSGPNSDYTVPLEWATSQLVNRPSVALWKQQPTTRAISHLELSTGDALTLTNINEDKIASKLDCHCKGFDFGRQQQHRRRWRHKIATVHCSTWSSCHPNELTMGLNRWAGEEFYDYICIDCDHDLTQLGCSTLSELSLLLLLPLQLVRPSHRPRPVHGASCFYGPLDPTGSSLLQPAPRPVALQCNSSSSSSSSSSSFGRIGAREASEPGGLVLLMGLARVLSNRRLIRIHEEAAAEREEKEELLLKLKLANLCPNSNSIRKQNHHHGLASFTRPPTSLASLNNNHHRHLARYCHYTRLERSCHYYCCSYYYYYYYYRHRSLAHPSLSPVFGSSLNLEWTTPLGPARPLWPRLRSKLSAAGQRCCELDGARDGGVGVALDGSGPLPSAPLSLKQSQRKSMGQAIQSDLTKLNQSNSWLVCTIFMLLAAHCLLPYAGSKQWFPVVPAAASATTENATGKLVRPMAPSVMDVSNHQGIRWLAVHWEANGPIGKAAAKNEWRLKVSGVPSRQYQENAAVWHLDEKVGQNKIGQKKKSNETGSHRKAATTSDHLLGHHHHHDRLMRSRLRLNHALSSSHHQLAPLEARRSKLKALNNDDYDNNDNSLSTGTSRKLKRNDEVLAENNRGYSGGKEGDLSVRLQRSRRRRSWSRDSSLRESQWTSASGGEEYDGEEGSSVSRSVRRRAKSLTDDNNNNNNESNLFLVYGHNNIDRAPTLLGRPSNSSRRGRRNKLIAGNRNDNMVSRNGKLPQAEKRHGFQLNSYSNLSLRLDKIGNGSISLAGTSLLRVGKANEEVKNGPFALPSRNRIEGASYHGLESRRPPPSPSSFHQSTATPIYDNREKRIERKLFRVETYNDDEDDDDDDDDDDGEQQQLDNKDTSRATDHYSNSTSSNNKESATIIIDRQRPAASISGRGHLIQIGVLDEPMKSEVDPGRLVDAPYSYINANGYNSNAQGATRYGASSLAGRPLVAVETEVPGGLLHTFGTNSRRSITEPLGHSGHEQSTNLTAVQLRPSSLPAAEEAIAAVTDEWSSTTNDGTTGTRKLGRRQRQIIGQSHAAAGRPNFLAGSWGHKVPFQRSPSLTFNSQVQSGGGQLMAAAAAAAAAAQAASSSGGGAQGGLCPTLCTCLWKNGKHFADCSNQQASSLPSQLPSGFDPLLQVLNYSSNHLPALPDSVFVNLNLNNLQRIYLSNCQLESIHPRAFHNLKLIVELDFSWNKLNYVPLPQIKQLSLMRRITMRGNPLYALNDATFSGGIIAKPESGGAVATPQQDTKRTEEDFLEEKDSIKLNEMDERDSRELRSDDRKWSSRQARRLFETYPELARSLVQAKRQEHLLPSEDNFIISSSGSGGNRQVEQMLFEALDWWVQQDEQQLASTSSSYSSAIYLSGPNASELDDELALDNNELLGSPNTIQHTTLGDHFVHLQELDFGQCKLTYIKWSTLERLNQLKRLLLDGNQLSQVSGKLVAALPVGLHQLSLEENPWKCDCRLSSLKHWLLATRTPLSAPVRCHPGNLHQSSLTHPTPHQTTSSNFQQHQQHWRRSTKKSARLQRLPPSASGLDEAEVPSSNEEDVMSLGGNQMDGGGQPGGRLATTARAADYLNDLTLDHFVCAPRALESAAANVRIPWTRPQSAQSSPTNSHMTQRDGLFRLPALETIFRYLEPTFIKPIEKQTNASMLAYETKHSPQIAPLDKEVAAANHLTFNKQQQQQLHRELVQAKEGERLILNCSLLAYTESSLDIIWLVDYNNHHSAVTNGAQQIHRSTLSSSAETQSSSNRIGIGNVGRLPVEERFIVLYDSKLHKYSGNSTNGGPSHPTSSNQEESSAQGIVWNEVSLYGTRILIRETRSVSNNSSESIFKESQIIIQSAHADDSARYKCIGLNKAGNTSIEYILRVGANMATDSQRNSPSGATISPLYHHSPTTRDQRAHTANTNNGGGNTYRDAVLEAANKARILASQSYQMTGASTSATNPSGTWLKSSRTFQITIVVVSVLMAAVIFAFLLFCIIIYQIKPSAAVVSGPVIVTLTEPGINPNNVVHNNNMIPLHNYGDFQLKSQLL